MIFITSTEDKASTKVQKVITENVKPTKDKLKIRSMRSTEKILIIETEMDTDAKRILNHSSLKGKKVLVQKQRKRNPL